MLKRPLTMAYIDGFSLLLLILGLVLTFFNFSTSLWYFLINLGIYAFSFGVIYLSRRFRQFVIYPTTTARPSQTPYSIYPWIPEGEVRWPAKLKKITITISNSLIIKDLSFGIKELIKDGDPVNSSVEKRVDSSTTTYLISFNPPTNMDINAVIRFTLEQNDEVEFDRPFLEYTVEYKPPKLPFTFKYRKRIF